MHENFCFTLRAARIVNELTQRQAAKILGISANTLSGYENYRSYPDVVVLKRMEELYGIPYANLKFPNPEQK